MLYKFENRKIYARAIEYSVAYHCNLKCSGCSHMSPFLAANFPSIESYSSDIMRLQSALHVEEIRLCGGEPLLNPQLNTFIRIAKESGIADHVSVTTNGLLLHKMDEEFWKSVDGVTVTLYPSINLKEAILQRAEECAVRNNTKFELFSNPNFRTTIVTQEHPNDLVTSLIFKTCENVHLYHCHQIHEGMLYKCAVPPFLPEYLTRMKMNRYDPKIDAFDIHKSRERDLYSDLKSFFLSNDAMEACCYCLGYLGKTEVHRQLDSQTLKNPKANAITRKTHLDRKKLHEIIQHQIDEQKTNCGNLSEVNDFPKRKRPKCSVVIPTYNRSKYLGRAINSILNQTFQDFEILVIDDCSTDNTKKISHDYSHKDQRINYYCLPENMGAQVARNLGIKRSSSKWIAFLDSDDEWLPHRLESGFAVQEKTGYSVIHSECFRTEGNDPTTRKMGIPNLSGNIYKDLLKEPNPMFQGLLVKRECFDRIGFLDESITSYQEWDTSIMLAKHFEFGYVPEPLFIYHCHSDETISKDMKRDADGWRQIVNKYMGEIVKQNGIEQLLEHYRILAKKYNSVGLYNIGHKYNELISILPNLSVHQLLSMPSF